MNKAKMELVTFNEDIITTSPYSSPLTFKFTGIGDGIQSNAQLVNADDANQFASSGFNTDSMVECPMPSVVANEFYTRINATFGITVNDNTKVYYGSNGSDMVLLSSLLHIYNGGDTGTPATSGEYFGWDDYLFDFVGGQFVRKQ